MEQNIKIIDQLLYEDEECLLDTSNIIVSDKPYDEEVKIKVLNYLFAEKHYKAASLGLFKRDVFTGKKMHVTGNLYSDGAYSWIDALGIYILVHDIELPQEFLAHILQVDDIHDCPLHLDWKRYSDAVRNAAAKNDMLSQKWHMLTPAQKMELLKRRKAEKMVDSDS